MCCLPATVEYLRGNPWFAPQWNAAEYLVSIWQIFLVFMLIEFIFLVIVTEAAKETSLGKTIVARFVHTIDPDAYSWSWKFDRGAEVSLTLDTVNSVEVCEQLWRALYRELLYLNTVQAHA